LSFLSTLQEQDGSWHLGGQKNLAATSLAVMAFLSAGHVPGEGPYHAQLDAAIRWVLRGQQGSGAFGDVGIENMYAHAICTLMLAEVAGMTGAELGRDIKIALAKQQQSSWPPNAPNRASIAAAGAIGSKARMRTSVSPAGSFWPCAPYATWDVTCPPSASTGQPNLCSAVTIRAAAAIVISPGAP
jgi:hypothetical protein